MSNELPILAQQKKADDLTPREIVRELDTYVVGQKKAKRAVAIALRNRIRRMKLSPDMIDEVAPKNIIMIGPTGVGKTEIARRLSRLTQSPFIKVEASKFTEVGYVGRDVESMVRDLVEISVSMVKQEQRQKVREKARKKAEERMLDLLMPSGPSDMSEDAKEQRRDTREKLRKMLLDGKLDDREVEVQVSQNSFPSLEIITGQGVEEMGINLKEMMPNMFGGKKKPRKMKVGEAMEHLLSEEEEGLLDMDAVTREARKRAENSGIIFLDEIDKISGRESGGKGGGPDVSREGVQRDILPIVEGTTVTTKYGVVKTDHILFLAAGAFHVSKPSDLIPELQGRFPIRVELDNLTRDDFIRILTEPRNALTKQYSALMETEGLKLDFTEDAVAEISTLAEQVNERTENIGARRLHTIMERLLEEVSFHASEMDGQSINIDGEYVKNQLKDIVKDQDLSRYIL